MPSCLLVPACGPGHANYSPIESAIECWSTFIHVGINLSTRLSAYQTAFLEKPFCVWVPALNAQPANPYKPDGLRFLPGLLAEPGIGEHRRTANQPRCRISWTMRSQADRPTWIRLVDSIGLPLPQSCCARSLSAILILGFRRVFEAPLTGTLCRWGVNIVNDVVATFKPVSRTTLSEQVAVQLAAELEAKRWAPGEKLPSEAELCKVFNVGRSTLREALKSLSFIGMIRMRAGGGSYVADHQSKYMERPVLLAKGVLNTEKEVNDLCEARLLIETELAGLCAQRATAQDFRNLERIVRDMKTSVDAGGEGFSELDLTFHIAIATASTNEVLTGLLKHIRDGLQELIVKSLLLPAGADLAYKQHRTLLEVLKQRNSARARTAMRNHLRAFQRGYKVLFQNPEQDSSQ